MKHLIYTILFLHLIPFSSFSQWEVVHCGPAIYNLDFVNDSTGYVLALDTATSNQFILKTIDFGISWDTTYTAEGALFLMDLSFPTEDIGYVSGGGMGYILKTMDGGETWIEQDLSEVWEVGTIEFQNELVGYGGNTDGYAAYVETHDGGENWEYNLEMGLRDVSIFDDCDIVMADGGGYYANENCVPWFTIYAEFGSGTFSSIEKTSSSNIFMGGLGWDGEVTFNYSILARSTNNGESFEFIEYPYMGTIYDIEFTNEDTGYAVTKCSFGNNPLVGYPTIFLKTTNGGLTWNYQEFIDENDCGVGEASRLSCISENICYATGSGRLFRTMNGGGDLHPMPVGIVEYKDLVKVNIFPNPIENKFNIESEFSMQRIEMYNAIGQKIFSIDGNDKKSMQIDISECGDGIYIIQIETEKGRVIETVVKN